MKTYSLVAFLLLLAKRISSQTLQSKASIDGVVVNLSSAQPMDRVVVELRSMAPQRIGTPAQLRLRTISTDVSGRYRFDRIPPGPYKLFAWEDVEKNSWRDSNFMRLYEDRGKTVIIREGAEESLDLTSIGTR